MDEGQFQREKLPTSPTQSAGPLSVFLLRDTEEHGDFALARSKESDWATRSEAATRLVRRYFPAQPDSPASSEQLIAEAALLDLSVTRHRELSRFDARPPEEIAEFGFQPNPEEAPGTLYEHIERRSCNYVSCTEVGAESVPIQMSQKRRSLAIDDTLLQRAEEFCAEYKEKLPEIQAVLAIPLENTPESQAAFLEAYQELQAYQARHEELFGVPVMQPFTVKYQMYEYRAEDLDGVRLETDIPGFIFGEQREITISHAPPENIREYRAVEAEIGWLITTDLEIVLAPNAPSGFGFEPVVKFSDWHPLASKHQLQS